MFQFEVVVTEKCNYYRYKDIMKYGIMDKILNRNDEVVRKFL